MTVALPDPIRHRPARRPRAWIGNVGLLLYFAVLTFALFGDLLTTSRAVASAVDMDVDQQYLAWRVFSFGELRAGRLPLWDPYSFGGAPALGNVQHAVLYPPNWLHLILPPARAINWVFAMHVWLAGVLAAAWCRSRRSGVIASALGGTIYALGGPLVLHVYAGHLNYVTTLAWNPLLFLAIDRIIAPRGGGGGGARAAWIMGTLAVAMQVLSGCPQPAYFAGLAALLYAALRLVGMPARRWLRAGGAIAAMFFVGAMMSAAQLLPAFEVGRESVRATPLDFATSASYSLPPANLLTLIAPHPLGDDFATPYAGRWLMWEVSLFVGPTALVLAILGAMHSRRRADRATAVLAMVMIVLAMGSYTPLFRLLYDWLPGWNRFRAPVRFNVFLSLMLAVLAARGFDLLLRRSRVRACAIRIAIPTLAVALLLACGAMFVKARPAAWAALLENRAIIERSAQHASAQLLWSAAVLAQAAVVLLLAQRVRWLAYAMAILVFADLTAPAGRAIQRFYPQLDAPPAWRETLASLAPDERVLTIDGRHPNLATQLAIEDAWGYDPAMPGRWGDLVGRLIGADPRAGDFTVRRVESSPLWSMFRVRQTLPPTPSFAPDPPMPRVLIVSKATVVDGPAASLATVFDRSFDPRQRVILESPPNPAPQPGATGSARVTRRDLGRLEITADVAAPAILLITDAYSGGWSVRSTTAPAHYDILPANHALRAIPLPAGHHELIVEYAPRSVTIGLCVSAVSWAALLTVCIALAAKNAKDAKERTVSRLL